MSDFHLKMKLLYRCVYHIEIRTKFLTLSYVNLEKYTSQPICFASIKMSDILHCVRLDNFCLAFYHIHLQCTIVSYMSSLPSLDG